ncbi:hypothetical protein MLD38_034038 [Melastoma candidum]|uniref:Uncharacterized protein n=1 Tax=Melastoma candidum TaxID=119954 RepID=A0ACB9M8N0_9MYRT|nr:hypothetical protein MLD38_034038 [Melastoma candidum]
MLVIAREVLRALSDGQNSDVRSILVQVVSVHIVSIPDTVMDGYGLDEEARIVGEDEGGSIFGDDEGASIFDSDKGVRVLEESFQSTMGFDALPASQEVLAALGRMRVDDGQDCTICLEELSPMADHTLMPYIHVFHDACILKWLETRHTCPLCRWSLPQEEEVTGEEALQE